MSTIDKVKRIDATYSTISLTISLNNYKNEKINYGI